MSNENSKVPTDALSVFNQLTYKQLQKISKRMQLEKLHH